MDDRSGSGTFSFLLAIAVVTGAFGVGIAYYVWWWLPEHISHERVQNERRAANCLKMLTTAEGNSMFKGDTGGKPQ